MAGRRLAGLGVLVLTVAVFWPVARFAFVTYDDPWFVTENSAVLSGLTWSGMRWAWENAYLGTGGPLTWLSHMADVQCFGLAAGWHHLTSLAFHALNGLLLYVFLARATSRVYESAIVAALFAVHPLHVESVAWVAQRKDVLSTFFWILAMGAYVSYARRPRPASYAAVLALHACGLLAKPMVATFPFVLLLLDVWPLNRWPMAHWDWSRVRRLLVEKLPLLVLSVVSLLATLQAQRQIGAVAESAALPISVRLANAVVSYVAYLRAFFWPSGLVPFYPYDVSIPAWLVAGSLLLLSALTLAGVALLRRLPAVPVGWAWYLGTLVPVIGIVQVGGHRMADRFTYVPSIGFFLAVVWGAAAVVRRLRVPRVATGALVFVALAVLAVAARAQVWVWQDSLSLWQHAVSVFPDDPKSLASLADSHAQAGQLTEAVSEYRRALEIDPGMPKVHNNFGLALRKLGDWDGARAAFSEALLLNPNYAAAHTNLASLLVARGEMESAYRHYHEAIRLDPTVGLPRINLAMALARDGRLAEALPLAMEAVRREPTRTDWRLALARLFADLGRREDAIRELTTVLAAAPENAEARRELAALRGR